MLFNWSSALSRTCLSSTPISLTRLSTDICREGERKREEENEGKEVTMATVTCKMHTYMYIHMSTSFKMLSCLSLAVSDTSWEIVDLLRRLSGRVWDTG